MALTQLVKYIYTNGTDEVIKRGKKIHASGYVELTDFDDLFGTAQFRIRDDNYATYYKVYVQKFKEPKDLSVRCTCPYNLGDICRHEVAALLQLQELIDKGMLQQGENNYDQRHTVAKMKNIEYKTIRLISSTETLNTAEEYLTKNKARIISAADETVKAEVNIDNKDYLVLIRKNEERNFDTSCDYVDTDHPLCLPKVIVFLQLLQQHGANYFDSIRNWDKEKNKLLELYGYSLADNLKGKFEFVYKDGKPFLRVLDPSIKRVAPLAAPNRPFTQPEASTTTVQEPDEKNEQPAPKLKTEKRLGVVFVLNNNSYPYFTLTVVIGEANESQKSFIGKVEVPDISRYMDTEDFTDDDKELLTMVRKLQDAEISKYINRNSPFAGIWENIIHPADNQLPAETRELIAEYIHPRLKKIATTGNNSLFFVLPAGKPFITAHLEPVEIMPVPCEPAFTVEKQKDAYNIICKVKAGITQYQLTDNEAGSPLFFLYNHQLWLWKNEAGISILDKFLPDGQNNISAAEWEKYLSDFILPNAANFKIDFEKSIKKEVKDIVPQAKIFLIEKGEYLVFQPVFDYLGYEVKPGSVGEITVAQGAKLLLIKRNTTAETAFIEKIQNLHSNFVVNEENGSLALKGATVLQNNWFFLFVDAMNEMKIQVYGYDALKNFRFNTAKPQTRIYLSSNTDWFDAKVEILFGNQSVTVADVKRALANKQQYVQLNDGTLGILPEEWLKKYSLLFRVGEGNTQNLKLSRYHISVVDELYENRNEEELFMQLEEQYASLRNFTSIEKIPPPQPVGKILRPYQVAGFQWLNYLKDVKWGGILADDMGLGKTVQALSLMQYFKDTNTKLSALVVCPTTLIYNWENEIKKFTPDLTCHIHHGAGRVRSHTEIEPYNIIITTYGTLRSDIKMFLGLHYDYVVLDESQAIKNPSSKITKAVGLLKARNRVCMSGTPLQNNTFDIYAQMNFLNPGMLGTPEYFRQEFAIPIDKLGEQDRKEHLRKILFPFILRRTKEQVAKDLPEKQEMILWCEMDDEQRRIYDAYRNEFRDKILGTIQQQGIQKSQLSILQGLMKLRQICDSPAIMNEEEKFENHSIKLDELSRELTENISNHKALIFSQFLGMLALIKERLEQLNIPYEYFDGSTTATDREKAIQSFQNNSEKRVFLISLKAGGVGLNLTAADYVYIVDPWWNPAVEQQAIDRTHRIGQTKNIFAYRMICRNTIEDKILQLQERKKVLARELISDDTGFVKSLSREDVEYLFS